MTEIPEALIHNACYSADTVAMQPHPTNAQQTKAIVTRALEALVANGMIEIVPEEDWPGWYIINPPYDAIWPTPEVRTIPDV